MRDVALWWTTVQVLTALFFPVTVRLCQNLPDRGYSLAKILGLLLLAYPLWLLSSFGLLDNEQSSIILVALVGGFLSWTLLPGAGNELRALWSRNRRMVLLVELLFAGAFLLWALVRAFEPQIAATEKPMEFAFLNGVLRSETFPPVDPWLSGYSISYYYFGYIIVGLLAKATGTSAGISFNLAVALLFALTTTGAFGVAYGLARAAGGGEPDAVWSSAKNEELVSGKRDLGSLLCGLLGALFTSIIGNLEGVLEIVYSRALLPLPFWNWIGIQNLDRPYVSQQWYPSEWMWWFRASRVIADYDPVSRVPRDYTINEFPFFSFLLGDLHPHVLALPFTILVLGLALSIVLSNSEPSLSHLRARPWRFLGLALVVGGLGFLNSWDMPTYGLVLAGAFALRKALAPSGLRLSVVRDSAIFLLLLLLAGVVLYLPFYLGFRSQASGIGLVLVRSKMHHFLIFWGPFILLCGAFLIARLLVARGAIQYGGSPGSANRLASRGAVYKERSRPDDARSGPPTTGEGLGSVALFMRSYPALLVVGGIAALLFSVQASVVALLLGMLAAGQSALRRTLSVEGGRADNHRAVTAFVTLLILLAALLLFATELLFVRDFFGNRMNTVFKVYYQAWVLMAIAGAYVVYYFAVRLRTRRLPRLTAILAHVGFAIVAILFALTLAYPVAAIPARTNGFQGELSLDGTVYLAKYHRQDYEAINWLQRNVRGTVVVLEGWGGSYSEYGRVSSTTGLPTVLGWDGHELQWRGSGDEAARRKADVDMIYRTTDGQLALQLLQKYGVAYVYAGPLERQKYANESPAWLAKFSDIGEIVYQNPGVTIFQIRAGKQG